MDSRSLLAAFPLFVILLLAGERTATLLLGVWPSSGALWQSWLWLHSSFGDFWFAAGAVTAHSFVLQLFLIACLIGLLIFACRTRKWVSIAFLANHAALIVACASIFAGQRLTLSSLELDALPPYGLSLLVNYPISPLHLALLIAGVASCAFCHLAFLIDTSRRNAPVISRVRLLQRNMH